MWPGYVFIYTYPKMMDAILHLQGACILKELPLPTLQRHMPYLAFFESFQLRGPRDKARNL